MRRISFHIEEELDAALAAQAAREGVSKAGLIRAILAKHVDPVEPRRGAPWEAITGWLDDEPLEDP